MRYDDPTEMLGGANMSSHVANEVKVRAGTDNQGLFKSGFWAYLAFL